MMNVVVVFGCFEFDAVKITEPTVFAAELEASTTTAMAARSFYLKFSNMMTCILAGQSPCGAFI